MAHVTLPCKDSVCDSLLPLVHHYHQEGSLNWPLKADASFSLLFDWERDEIRGVRVLGCRDNLLLGSNLLHFSPEMVVLVLFVFLLGLLLGSNLGQLELYRESCRYLIHMRNHTRRLEY